MKARRITGCIVVSLSLACAVRANPDVDARVTSLSSEDPKAAEEARRYLEAKGTEVVPVLFDKLLVADWTLRPRLLEVLSAHGREFAKQKLKDGSDTEKIYAALVYELSVACAGDEHDYDSPDFKAMVEALLKAIRSEDKSLRAAASAALVYDEESTVFFDHLHEIVPALISSFDTDLFIDRCTRGGPVAEVILVIGYNLEAMVGDRLINVEEEIFARPAEAKVNDPRDIPGLMRKILSDNRSKVNEIQGNWATWWKDHSKLSSAEIGRLMIERSLRILATAPQRSGWDAWAAEWCLQKWAGTGVAVFDWRAWWELNKDSYWGPIKRQR